jgi:hypothetical protein
VLRPSAAERKFTIVDAMILVAASAVAFVIVRPVITSGLQRAPRWAIYLAAAMAWLITWTPTVLLLRLRRPRPPLRRLGRQPGFAAAVAASSILTLTAFAIALLALVRLARRGALLGVGRPVPKPTPGWWMSVVLEMGVAVGPAVLGAWLLLALSGRRRPARGWLDALGRVLGAAWIVLFVIHCVARLSWLKG